MTIPFPYIYIYNFGLGRLGGLAFGRLRLRGLRGALGSLLGDLLGRTLRRFARGLCFLLGGHRKATVQPGFSNGRGSERGRHPDDLFL